MSLYKLPKKFHPDFISPSKKPICPVEIDWSNPITLGLKLCYFAGQPVDLTTRAPSVSTAPTPTPLNGNIMVQGNGATSRYVNLANSITIDAGCTVAMSAYLNTQTGYFFDHINGTNRTLVAWTGTEWFLYLGNQTRSNVGADWCNAGTHNGLVVGYRRSAPTDTYWFKNGTKYTKTSSGSIATGVYNFQPHLLERYSNANPLNGGIGVFLVYDRCLSEAECSSLSANIYQVFRPANDPYYFVPSGGTPSYSILLNSGTYSYTGTTLNTIKDSIISANTNSYQVIGTSANTLKASLINVNTDSYAVSGTGVNTIKDSLISTNTTSYLVSGTDLIPTKSSVIAANTGVYTVVGTDAGVLKNYLVAPEGGSYTYTGTSLGLIKDSIIATNSGVYNIIGTDLNLNYGLNINLTIDSGNYSLTGTSLDLLKQYYVSVGNGSYSYSGVNIGLLATRYLTIDNGVYSYSGTDLSPLKDSLIGILSGSYSFIGTDITLGATNNVITVDSGVYSLVGTDITFSITSGSIVQPPEGRWIALNQDRVKSVSIPQRTRNIIF